MRYIASALIVGNLLLLAGCQSSKSPQISYTQPVMDDDTFAKGANRPPTAETLYRMAKLLEAQGKDDEAYTTLLNSIDRYPDYVPSYIAMSALQVRQRKLAAGQATLEKALAISPNDAIVLNDLGMVWMLQNDYSKALDYFTQASAQKPDEARYVANMALATGMQGRYDESYALYEKVMRPARAHYNLSIVAEARNDMQKANEEWAKASALDSSLERKVRNKR